MSDEGIRLAKRVADTVPCSRGEAERYIAGGWVSVDGALALLSADTLQQDGPGPRFLKRHLVKLVATTPLEAGASGLLVLTQDWRVQRKLVDEGDRIEQEFVLETTETVSDEALAKLNAAIPPNMPLKVSRQSEARLRFAGKRIRSGQLAALCAGAGLAMKSLRRLRIGKVAVSSLPLGRWRYVKDYERF